MALELPATRRDTTTEKKVALHTAPVCRPSTANSTTQHVYYDEYISDGRDALCKVLDPGYTRPLLMDNFDRIHGLGFLYIHMQNLMYLSSNQEPNLEDSCVVKRAYEEMDRVSFSFCEPKIDGLFLEETASASENGNAKRQKTVNCCLCMHTACSGRSPSALSDSPKTATVTLKNRNSDPVRGDKLDGKSDDDNASACGDQCKALTIIAKQPADRRQLLKIFDIGNLPILSLKQFLERLNKYLMLPIPAYIASSYFLHRLFYQSKSLRLTEYNSYKLVSTYIRIAEKLIQDDHSSKEKFWKAAGWNAHNKHNSRLEINAIELLDFDISIDAKSLNNHLKVIKQVNCQVTAMKKLHSHQ